MAINKFKFKDGYENEKDNSYVDFVGIENNGVPLTGDDLQKAQARLAGKSNEIIDVIDSFYYADADKPIKGTGGITVNVIGHTRQIGFDKTSGNFLGFAVDPDSKISDGNYNGILVTDIFPNGIEFSNIDVGRYFEVTNKDHFPDGATFTKQTEKLDSNHTEYWFVNGFVKSDYTSKIEFIARNALVDQEFAEQDIVNDEINKVINQINAEFGLEKSRIDKNKTDIATGVDEASRIESKVDDNAKKIAANLVIIDDNTKEIFKSNTEIAGIVKSKQNVKLAYKSGTVTVEKQIEDNENLSKELRDTELPKLVTKIDGEMAPGYISSGAKTVIPKDEFDTAIQKKEDELTALREELAKKADVSDLAQKPLIYIPGQGTDENAAVTPIIPVINGGQLEYTFDAADWAAWKTRVDADGKLLINGITSEIGIKDSISTTYPGQESYNNGSETKQPFGTDPDARWNLNDGNLIIITNNQNRDITRTIRQMTFLVESTAGAGVDQKARDDIAGLDGSKQNKKITPIVGMNADTVEGALAELKNAKDALEDKTQDMSYGPVGTKFTTNIQVGEDIWVDGTIHVGGKEPENEVALKKDILDTIVVDDDSTTVLEARNRIIASLKDQEGRKSVIFEHSSSTQQTLAYQGAIEKIEQDPIEGGPAYFGESNFNQFTNINDGISMIWQLFLNIIGWKTWQKSLPDNDPIRVGTDAEIDAYDQTKFDAVFIKNARREIEMHVDNVYVLTDSLEQTSFDAMETLLKGAL